MSDDDTTAEESAEGGEPQTATEAEAESEPQDGAETETAVAEPGSDESDDPDPSAESAEGGETQRLALQVEITDSGPCLKHVVVTIPRSDLDRLHAVAVSELTDSAEIHGFRKGHVPIALVAKRFRRELSDEVKQKVILSSLEQLSDDHDLEPINEPNLDVEAIEIPEEGDFEYEFDVEVRPTFDLPDYRGLKIDRPIREINDKDVENQLQSFLQQFAHMHDHDGPAAKGDAVVADLTVEHAGEKIKTIEGEVLQLWPVLRFFDAELEGFDELMAGVAAGEERTAELTVSAEAGDIAMRGETVSLTIRVQDVKQLHEATLDQQFLDRVGMESEEELREALKASLKRQVEFDQRQSTRQQVLDQITVSADWELPEELVAKQTENALRREMLEMQQAGFTPREIQARENEIRQNAISNTRQAMKEHFVLDRIVEEEELVVSSEEIEAEIGLMAMQSGESPRRLRARMIRSGMIENLEAQIRERKAIDVILEHAEFNDTTAETPVQELVTTVDQSICQSIPEAAAEPAAAGEEAEPAAVTDAAREAADADEGEASEAEAEAAEESKESTGE